MLHVLLAERRHFEDVFADTRGGSFVLHPLGTQICESQQWKNRPRCLAPNWGELKVALSMIYLCFSTQTDTEQLQQVSLPSLTGGIEQEHITSHKDTAELAPGWH